MERSRRSVLLSVPPLWLIGVCLFLPTVRACERMETPASFVRGTWRFTVLLSPYLVAELLAVIVIVALARDRLTPLLRRATLALALLASSSACILAVLEMHDLPRWPAHAWGMFAAACAGVSWAVLWRARRADEWTRQARALAAYTVATLPLATFLLRIGCNAGTRDLGYGAWLFLAAVAALFVIHARDLVRSSSA